MRLINTPRLHHNTSLEIQITVSKDEAATSITFGAIKSNDTERTKWLQQYFAVPATNLSFIVLEFGDQFLGDQLTQRAVLKT